MLNPPVEEQVEQELSELSINSKKLALRNFQNDKIQQTNLILAISIDRFQDLFGQCAQKKLRNGKMLIKSAM